MNFRTTLIIFILFALSAGGYFLFWDGDTEESSDSNEQPRISEIYELSVDTVQRIRLSFKDSAYQPLSLARDDNGEWQLTDPITAYANRSKVSEMLDDLLNKRVKRTLEVSGLSQYELDPPNIRIDLWTEGETPTQSFLIGNKTVNYSVYAKEASESHIFLIESSALQDLTKSPADLRTRNALKFEPEAVNGITLAVAGGEPIRCRMEGEAEWRMVAPIQVKGDAKEIRSVLDALHLLKVAEFTKDGAINLAEYGLEVPRIRVTLQLGGESQELLVGSDILNATRIYVKPGARDAVYAVNREIYATLNKTVFDLHDKRVIDFQRTATNRFEIQRQEQAKIVCAKDLKGNWQIEDATRIYVKPGARDAVYAVNREIYATLNKTVFDLRGKRVIDFQRTATNRFEIQRQGQAKIVCAKDLKGNWKIEEPIALKADAEIVDDILFGVDSLKAVEFVAEQPTSLSRYGLDAPSLQVSFFPLDAEPAVLLLGKIKGDKVYAKVKNAKRVALVRGDLLELIGSGVAGLRDKQVLQFESDDAFKLSLRHGDVQLTCQKQGVNWRLVSPVQEDANNGAVNSMIYRLGGLKADKYLASAPGLNVTRLNKPEVQATVTLENLKEFTLQIGMANEHDQRYARLRATPDTVFLLEPSISDELRKTVADLRHESSGL